jgi:hypothetical protein
MTRAFVNFVYLVKGEKEVLQFYYNGDQYPSGLRDVFNIFEFLNSKFRKQDFSNWAKKNYSNYKIAPLIKKLSEFKKDFVIKLLANKNNFSYNDNDDYFDDYSYIFDSVKKEVLVHHLGEVIFNNSLEEFKKWLKKVEF